MPLSSGRPGLEESWRPEGRVGFHEVNSVAWRYILGPHSCWMWLAGAPTLGVSCSRAGLRGFAFARIQKGLGQRLRVSGMGPGYLGSCELSLQTMKITPVLSALERERDRLGICRAEKAGSTYAP